jgi:hypothetical protein
MISTSKYKQALRAVQDVFILARKFAHERADHAAIARLLDYAEYLPGLILDEEDTTKEFRDNLVDIADQFSWAVLLERFDEDLDETPQLVGHVGQNART